jgi:hypothetical protein
VVLGVDQEDDAVDLGEVVSPDTAGWCRASLVTEVRLPHWLQRTLLMAAKIKSGELDVADGEFFGGYEVVSP